MLFQKPSLRTRVTFEAGMTQLGGHAVHLATSDVGLGARESVARCRPQPRPLGRRDHGPDFDQAVVEELAEAAGIPVINALTDLEHPCQALADLFTLRERFGAVDGLVWPTSATATTSATRSPSRGALRPGPAGGPSGGYGPDPAIVARARAIAAETGGRIVLGADPRDAVGGAAVIYTDAWTSMGQEAEAERRRTDFAGFRVDEPLRRAAGPSTLVMHCLPAHRDEEIASEVLDGPFSVVLDQAENRLHVQKGFLAESLEGR